MAIIITQERKKQRYLLLALTLIIFAILFVVWFGFFQKKKDVSRLSVPAVNLKYVIPKVEIDWQMLDDLRKETPQTFEEIGAFEGEFGRENPFVPY